MSIAININGLLLTKELAEFFVNEKIDSITFSIDAMPDEVLNKVRGVMVRSTPIIMHYNKIDRLETWKIRRDI